MQISKKDLRQIIKEELSSAMSESETWKMGRSMKAVDLAADKGIADAQEDFARIQAGGKVLQIDTTEETQEEEDAYNKGWQNEMDRLQQSAADRKLNRPPEPETDADREAAEAEYDFESHFSESRKITKSKLAQIVKEELDAMKAEGYDAGQAVWMEKFKLHARVPQNQELSDEMKNNAQDAFRQGMDPVQAAKELSAVTAEGYKAYNRDDDERPKRELSPHAKELADRTRKGRSIKNKNAHLDDEQDRAEKLGLSGGLDEDGSGYSWGSRKPTAQDSQPPDFELEAENQQSVWERLVDEGAEDAASAVPLNFDLPLSDEQEEYYSHLDSEDRQSMLQDVIDELVMDGKVGDVGNGMYYPIGEEFLG